MRTIQISAFWLDGSPAQRFLNLLGAFLLSFLVACTTLPTQEFGAYKEAFAKARAAGEDVLLDYGKAKEQCDVLQCVGRASQSTKPSGSNPGGSMRPSISDITAVTRTSQRVDHVAIRFRAWEVVARYNDSLTALAEGRSAQELGAAVGGLVQSLDSFPVDAIKDAVGSLAPFLGPLRILMVEAERERARQLFLNAIEKEKESNLINGEFIGHLLKADIEDFWKIRYGLNNLQYKPLLDRIFDLTERFGKLARRYQLTKDVNGQVGRINLASARLPRLPDGKQPVEDLAISQNTSIAPTPEVNEQLLAITSEIEELVEQALKKNAELVAYKQVLIEYSKLLDQTSGNINKLRAAAQAARPTFQPSGELLDAVVSLRQAFLKYNAKE